jgi:hypothetical protein
VHSALSSLQVGGSGCDASGCPATAMMNTAEIIRNIEICSKIPSFPNAERET